MANTVTVAARIAALVRKHAQPSANLQGLEQEIAHIAALAVAAASGFSHSAASPVTLEWFKLANRAEIKLTAETTQALSLALVARRGQRVVLVFADPDLGGDDVLPASQGVQADLVEVAAALPPHDPETGELTEEPSPQPQNVSGEVPDLPEALDRRKSKAKRSAKPKAEAEVGNQGLPAAAPRQAPEVAEPWISSVDEPNSYDPDTTNFAK